MESFDAFLTCEPCVEKLYCVWFYCYYQMHIARNNMRLIEAILDSMNSKSNVFSAIDKNGDISLSLIELLEQIKRLKKDMKQIARLLCENHLRDVNDIVGKIFDIVDSFDSIDQINIEKIVTDQLTYADVNQLRPSISLFVSSMISIKHKPIGIFSFDINYIIQLNDDLSRIHNLMISHFKPIIQWFDDLIEDAILMYGIDNYVDCYELARIAINHPDKPYHEMLGCYSVMRTEKGYKIVIKRINKFIKELDVLLEYIYEITDSYSDCGFLIRKRVA